MSLFDNYSGTVNDVVAGVGDYVVATVDVDVVVVYNVVVAAAVCWVIVVMLLVLSLLRLLVMFISLL